MKKLSVAIAVAGMVAMFSAAASADQPGADWLKPEQVTQRLAAAGYSNFSKLEADDGHWELEADLKGVRYDLKVDPKTAEVIKSERDND